MDRGVSNISYFGSNIVPDASTTSVVYSMAAALEVEIIRCSALDKCKNDVQEAIVNYDRAEAFWKEIEVCINAKETSNKIELDVWGEVTLVTEQQKNKSLDDVCTLVYLSDEQGNILYKFYISYVGNTKVTDFLIEDINKDNLEDVAVFTSNDKSGMSGK